VIGGFFSPYSEEGFFFLSGLLFLYFLYLSFVFGGFIGGSFPPIVCIDTEGRALYYSHKKEELG